MRGYLPVKRVSKRRAWLAGALAAILMPAMGAPVHGPGLYETPVMVEGASSPGGTVGIYNSKSEFVVDIKVDGWQIAELHLYVEPYSWDDDVAFSEIPEKKENVDLSKFPHKQEFVEPENAARMVVPFPVLFDDGFEWGVPGQHKRTMAVVLHADLVQLEDGVELARNDAWAHGEIAVPYSNNGTGFVYEMAHPMVAHLRDSPVIGATVDSPTFKGKTGESGDFPFFPGESAVFSVGAVPFGKAVLDRQVTPLDFFGGADTSDPRVANVARLLQSLDADGDPDPTIELTPQVEGCLEAAMTNLGVEALDFTNDASIEEVINETLMQCAGVEGLSLASVSAEEAIENLEKSLESTMFRKNVSKTPELVSSKSKLNIMGMWFPALKANGEEAVIEYYDDTGALIRTAEEAKPVVVTYTDGVTPGTTY